MGIKLNITRNEAIDLRKVKRESVMEIGNGDLSKCLKLKLIDADPEFNKVLIDNAKFLKVGKRKLMKAIEEKLGKIIAGLNLEDEMDITIEE